MAQRVLVVGGGLTGAVAASELRKSLGQNAEIECWEYLNDSGGRLATTQEQGVVADVATSVISLDAKVPRVQKMRDAWIAKGFLKEADTPLLSASSERPKGSHWQHFFVPHGTSTLVDYLFQTSKVKVKTNCCVDSCSLDPEEWKWYVEASGGKSGGRRQAAAAFDAVVLCNGPTHPGCERMDNIWGEWQDVVDEKFWNALWNVTWSSCYVVTLSLSQECLEPCERFFGESAIQRTMDDDLIKYVTYESRKRQHLTGKNSSGVVLVCHTTAEAMWYYKRAQCVQAVQDHVLNTYLRLPKQLARKVVQRTHSRCWGKCQPQDTISTALGKTTSHWSSNATASPPLVLCGDYFLGPTCSDAINSACSAADTLASALAPAQPVPLANEMHPGISPPSPSKRWADEPVEGFEEAKSACTSAAAFSQPVKRWGRNGPRTSASARLVACA